MNPKKSWTFPPVGDAKIKQILGRIEELWLLKKTASYKATVVPLLHSAAQLNAKDHKCTLKVQG